MSVDGQVVEVGDYQQLFSIQSISKPFMFGLALEDHGREDVLGKVSVEPTGEAFNSIVLDEETNRPFNPLVNAGAIATADLVEGQGLFRAHHAACSPCSPATSGGRSTSTTRSSCPNGPPDTATGRSRHLMLNFGMIRDRVDETLELYFQQCSLLVNCHDLAVMGATLANGGVNPVTGERAIKAEYVKDVLSIMAVVRHVRLRRRMGLSRRPPRQKRRRRRHRGRGPGQFGIGLFSPPLDAKGNSVRGVQVCRELSERFGLHVFEAGHEGPALVDQFRPHRA